MKKLILVSFLTLLIILVPKHLVKNNTSTYQAIPKIINQSPAPTSLPKYYLIKVPFIPQAPEKNWDQPWQDACEEAAILTVKYYYSNQNPSTEQIISDYNEIFNKEISLGFSHDLNLAQMATVSAQMFNLKSEIISYPTIEVIKSYLNRNLPIIAPANGKILYRENKHFKSGGPWYHNLVILGYDDNRQQFIVHDVGTQFGANYHYSYNTLIDSLHDFPDSNRKEDINLGVKNILVLVK